MDGIGEFIRSLGLCSGFWFFILALGVVRILWNLAVNQLHALYLFCYWVVALVVFGIAYGLEQVGFFEIIGQTVLIVWGWFDKFGSPIG